MAKKVKKKAKKIEKIQLMSEERLAEIKDLDFAVYGDTVPVDIPSQLPTAKACRLGQ